MYGRVGILGGMGPLASAELLGTIYRLNLVEPEQEAPVCILLSDPTFPDRTEAILARSPDVLTGRLEKALQSLLDQEVDLILIACMTIHSILPRVSEPLRRKVVSLVDLMADDILAVPRRRLLLATTGSRISRLFESHDRWPQIENWVVFPEDGDQSALHQWIYRLKVGANPEECLYWIDTLVDRYEVQGLLFGCTELHLLQRPLAARPPGPTDVIDPLWTAARDLRKMLGKASS